MVTENQESNDNTNNDKDSQNQESKNGNPDPKPGDTDAAKNKGAVSFYKEEVGKYRTQLNEMAESNKKMTNKIEEMENNNLKQQNNYKELYEKQKTRADEAVTRADEVGKGYLTDKKRTALQLEASKSGINSDYMDFLLNSDTSKVQVETTDHGNVNILGATEFVETFKASFPAMFKPTSGPNVNNNNPQVNPGTALKNVELLDLQRKNPVAYKKYMKDKYDIA